MQGIIIIGITALFLGIILSIADNVLKNKEAEKIEKMLPGYNCGACGFGSCKGMALAIINNHEVYKKCRILKGEKLEMMKKYINE